MSVIRCIVDRSCVHAVVHERASAVTPETGAQMTHRVSPPLQSVWTRGPPAHSQIHAICHSERVNPYLLTGSEEYRLPFTALYDSHIHTEYNDYNTKDCIMVAYFLFSRNIKDFKHYFSYFIRTFSTFSLIIKLYFAERKLHVFPAAM